MGKIASENKNPDYIEVIKTIKHHLQYGAGAWSDESHEECARSLECGDAQRALVEIGAALDRVNRDLIK